LDAVLTVQQGARAGRSFRLGRRVKVGQSSQCEIRLPDMGVASYHFILEYRSDHYLLRDLGSEGGTYVDGARVMAERLQDGTTIYAGEAVLFFQEMKGEWPAEVELLEAGTGSDLENEVRRIYESSVTYLADPEPGDEGSDTARTALSALYRVGRLSGKESDLAALFEGTANILLDALSGERCFLLLNEGEGRYRRAAECVSPGGRTSGPPPLATILNRAAREGLSLLIRDASRDARFQSDRVGSVICVPLKAARKVLGAIYCDVPAGGKTFDENDLKLATAVGRQAGGAIERRILEEQLYENSQRLELRVKERTQELADAMGELKTAQSRLVLSERLAAMGLLVQGIAHNMATPLSGILGYAQVLKTRHPDLPHLDEIIHLCRHLDGIIGNLLAKGRHDAQTDPVLVDLNALVDETLTFFQGDMFFKHEVQLSLEKEDHLPPIWGIWSDFSQSLQNLIQNALDAMKASPRKVLRIRTFTDEAFLSIEVADTGCGIPPDHVNRIFDPFFSTKAGKGTGLGLFTTRNLLSPYGAEMLVERESEGTCFRVRIPRIIAKENEADVA
jgi:signal transduction histidine kinase